MTSTVFKFILIRKQDSVEIDVIRFDLSSGMSRASVHRMKHDVCAAYTIQNGFRSFGRCNNVLFRSSFTIVRIKVTL